MGVNTLYLLPIFEYSRQNKKGDLGSVYAINSFTNLDPDLKHNTPLTIEEEFQCLVEVCHLMSIRIIVDIVPRLTAVDSPYILSNPE
jgi:glycosidase